MRIFSKKIVATQITEYIEKATDPSVISLDWELVFQICDSVNTYELGAKEARKVLQRKILFPDPKVQVLSLEILNCLVENSKSKFLPQLGSKTFGEDLIILGSTRNLDKRAKVQLYHCLEKWIEHTQGEFEFIKKAFDIISHPVIEDNKARKERPKVRNVTEDIEIAKNIIQLFSQTLSFTDPLEEDISKNELIQEFYKKSKKIQQVLLQHLQTIEEVDTISTLINTNNDLLISFKSYEEMIEQKKVKDTLLESQTVYNNSTGFVVK